MLKKNIIAGILVKNFDEALDFYTVLHLPNCTRVTDFPMVTILAVGNHD